MASISSDPLGIHAEVLSLRAKRAKILAGNLANADTPNFKARDYDFETVLRRRTESGSALLNRSIRVTHAEHIATTRNTALEPKFRIPTQPTIDGNTVESHVEKAKFMENALGYQSTILFIKARLHNLLSAIRGE